MSSLTVMVRDELESTTGVGDEELAEFVINIANTSDNEGGFKVALEEIGAGFPSLLITKLWRMVNGSKKRQREAGSPAEACAPQDSPVSKRMVDQKVFEAKSSDAVSEYESATKVEAAARATKDERVLDFLEDLEEKVLTAPEAGKTTSVLPSGFFDDKEKDAKARNVPVHDEDAEELQRFEKAVANEVVKSQELAEVDFKSSMIDRELMEHEEQQQFRSRAARLQQIRAEVVQRLEHKSSIEQDFKGITGGGGEAEISDSNSNSENDEGYSFGWRAKCI